MRCRIATVLAMVLSWLLIQPALAASTHANIPQCCLKNGKHKCMSHGLALEPSGPAVSTVAEKCNSCPHSTLPAQFGHTLPPTGQAVFADLLGHPSAVFQTEARYRISHDRSRQKRGPPSLILS